MSFTFHDLFCGAGGSITGLIAAGGELVAAVNHWDRACETVDTNHGATGGLILQADVNHLDMRRLRKAQVLWASVLCTEGSPAGGKRKARGQIEMDLEEHGHVPAAAFERTRACALDVLRATEIHRYDIVVVENVVEFARDWELFDWWIEGMCKLRPGYEAQIVCLDSAHIAGPDNPPAPQWRGRIYVVFNRKGVPRPDLTLRPTSWCPSCDALVEGVQWWKRTDRRLIGKYGPHGQYLYRCSTVGCDAVVEPLVLPAVTVIDLTDVGERIGDRKRPLVASTMARIQWGLDNLVGPLVATVAGNTFERGSHRVWPAEDAPLNTRVATTEDALVQQPFLVKNYGKINEAKYRSFGVDQPLGSITTEDSHGLVQRFVLPNRVNARMRPADGEPLPTITTSPSGGQYLVNANHDDVRVRTVGEAPLPACTSKIGDGLLTPLVSANRRGGVAQPADQVPLATLATGGHLELTQAPFYVKAFGGNARPEHLAQLLATSPLGSITTKDHHHLVIPYRRGKPKTTGQPLHTLGTLDSAGLCHVDIDILDCHYRMLRPPEHALAQRFPTWYRMEGNLGEQTMLAGNAVSVNAGQFIGVAIAEALR